MIKEGLKKFQERKFCEALNIFNNLIKLNPNDGDLLFTLGNIYYSLNDLNMSSLYFERSLKIFPKSQIIMNNYGLTLQSLGQFDKAKELFKNLIILNPNNIKAYYRLFRMNLENFEKDYLDKVKLLETSSNLNLEDKGLINFIISKFEKNKNIKNEIKFLNYAHEDQFNSQQLYNQKKIEFYTKIMANNFSNLNFLNKDTKIKLLENKKPIFIIGLPRSGSTLIETLLTRNEQSFYSYGESSIFDISIFNQIEKNILTKGYDSNNFEISVDKGIFLNSINNTYSYSNNELIIDKSLENFFYIDLILKIFPEAKFIHTFRNTMDNAIAIYQSMLIYMPWTHSIENISKYILNYKIIIDYFKKKYPEKILDIELGDFTNNPNTHSKKIFNFCNIPITDNILEFHDYENFVSKTSSFMQVRNKIQKYDKNKYKSYYYLIDKKF